MSRARITAGTIERKGFIVKFEKTSLYIRDEDENEIELDILDAVELCDCLEKAFEEVTDETFYSFRQKTKAQTND